MAPGHGWAVAVRVDRIGSSGLRAEGEITDQDGVSVAHRTLSGASTDCGALARALGVWASLVLDAELRRAPRGEPGVTAGMPPTSPGSTPSSTRTSGTSESAGEERSEGGGGTGATEVAVASAVNITAVAGVEPTTMWPAPASLEKPSPEHDWYLHHDEGRTLELGAGAFLMTGTGGGALAGPTAFAVVEAGRGLFLRPAVAFGESLTSLPPADVKAATWAAARFDTCLRVPGLYSRHHGMQLDLCAGTDLGYTTIESTARATLPYLDLGPSIDLRGELGGRLSAVLRVVAGVNLLRDSFTDLSGARETPPLAEGRLELAFSWDVR
jgi:hypothetical protein